MEQAIFAAEHFGFFAPLFELLTDGLIHKTYKVTSQNKSIILQQVNTSVFTEPEKVIANYEVLSKHLSKKNGFKIPSLLKTISNQRIYIDTTGSCWRAFEYIPNSYTENLPLTKEKIFSAAQCYGMFTQHLFDLDTHTLTPTIPGFHDLNNRYNQLQQAIGSCQVARLKESEGLLRKAEERKALVHFFDGMGKNSEFKIRPMHHDSKLSNILFDTHSKKAICPIDLDTTMPGYFFSDIGDMIRTMVSSADESSSTEGITIQKDFYKAIIDGYKSGIGDAFTETENSSLHYAGPLMIYMQGIRFLTDYLSNDVYYKISYPQQNFDRAANQFSLLEKLEIFLKEEYQYELYK